jgi:ferredoxin-NADP reductase
MDLEITAIRNETSRIKAFELHSPDGQDLPLFTAGAHIDVSVVFPDGTTDTRSYSLAGDPGDPSRYEIAVLHLPDSKGGSAFMHTQLKKGHRLACSDPINAFPLSNTAHHHVLIAGGIGITPLRAMAYELRTRGADFEIRYAAHTREDMAYGTQLGQLVGDRLHLYFSQTDSLTRWTSTK